MHMRYKEKIKRYSIVILLAFISVITVSLISGRINTVDIVVISKDGIDVSKNLTDQQEFFTKKAILKSEMAYFQNSVVTDLNQTEGKVLKYPLKAGSPIPLDALTSKTGAGQFAASLPKGKTIHKLTDALANLPPVQPGDVINIALSFTDSAQGGSGGLETAMLMRNVKVYSINQTNLYVEVTLKEDYLLSTAAKMGSFVYQLPGQKALNPCTSESKAKGIDCYDPTLENLPIITKQQILDQITKSTSFQSSAIEQTANEATSTINKAISNPDSNPSNNTTNNGGDK